jgi:hypothetical protein
MPLWRNSSGLRGVFLRAVGGEDMVCAQGSRRTVQKNGLAWSEKSLEAIYDRRTKVTFGQEDVFSNRHPAIAKRRLTGYVRQ